MHFAGFVFAGVAWLILVDNTAFKFMKRRAKLIRDYSKNCRNLLMDTYYGHESPHALRLTTNGL